MEKSSVFSKDRATGSFFSARAAYADITVFGAEVGSQLSRSCRSCDKSALSLGKEAIPAASCGATQLPCTSLATIRFTSRSDQTKAARADPISVTRQFGSRISGAIMSVLCMTRGAVSKNGSNASIVVPCSSLLYRGVAPDCSSADHNSSVV